MQLYTHNSGEDDEDMRAENAIRDSLLWLAAAFLAFAVFVVCIPLYLTSFQP